MSHLAHIVTFKKTLIADGITDPKLQIELTRSAYVRALISLKHQSAIDGKDFKPFCNHVLSYWNETSPVAGSLVVSEVIHFFAVLDKALSNVGEMEVIQVPVTTAPELPEGKKLTEMASYTDLVNALLVEASEKYKTWVEEYC